MKRNLGVVLLLVSVALNGFGAYLKITHGGGADFFLAIGTVLFFVAIGMILYKVSKPSTPTFR